MPFTMSRTKQTHTTFSRLWCEEFLCTQSGPHLIHLICVVWGVGGGEVSFRWSEAAGIES